MPCLLPEHDKLVKHTPFINLVEIPEAVELFKGAKNSSDMLLRLSAITSVLLLKGETLVFFDEVQQCPDIVTAIKFLVDDGSYRYWAESWTLSSS